MSNKKKKENLPKSNFGHTEDEWGIKKEKKHCECGICKNTMKKRKVNLNTQRIATYKLKDDL
ncbi:MAG: hypothetical protein H8D50_00495 [Thaumarchaeota archaeon]|nr:hypothetical protein [Nitrososphaerota archaeon]